MPRPRVFLFGATRSGTSWLQKMLGAHPLVATPQELDLFSEYVAPLHAAWDAQVLPPEEWHRRRFKGLPSVLTREEFDAVVRELVESVYERVLAAKPGAEIVLEKVPGYAAHVPAILRHFPEARLVHIVRDGRDVAVSLRRAARGWGRGWAAATAEHAAWVWRTNVEAGRAAAALTPNFLELRYEELASAEGPELLRRTLAFAGAEATSAEAAAIYERFARKGEESAAMSTLVWAGEVRRRFADLDEPEGFLDKSRTGGWREQLGAFERWSFEREAGALLRELGYTTSAAWVRPGLWRLLGPGRRLCTSSYGRARFALGAARHAARRPTSVHVR